MAGEGFEKFIKVEPSHCGGSTIYVLCSMLLKSILATCILLLATIFIVYFSLK